MELRKHLAFCQRGEKGGQRSETVGEVELTVLMSIKSRAERNMTEQGLAPVLNTEPHRLKWKSSMEWGEGSVCVWMGVQPAEIGEAEEVEVQYKTGNTECEEP